MKLLNIEYNHEFISNKIKDELLLNDIWKFKELEKDIVKDINDYFNFDIGLSRNVNTLSGGQRSITYLVTLSYILKFKNINNITIHLNNIKESLSILSWNIIYKYLTLKGINID